MTIEAWALAHPRRRICTSAQFMYDESERRVEACRSNARRLGIRNARFFRLVTEAHLPFEDASFDGITAASSIEQTVDPAVTLTELHRVLRPGGALRFTYEGLGRYAGGQERVGMVTGRAGGAALDRCERDIAHESALTIRACTSIGPGTLGEQLALPERWFALDELSVERLERLDAGISEVRLCRLMHPSGELYSRLCEKAGFTAVGTHNGAQAARTLFESARRRYVPASHDELTEYLLPIVDSVVTMEAPLSSDPWISAVKRE